MVFTQEINLNSQQLKRLIFFLNIITVIIIMVAFLGAYFKVQSSQSPLALHYNVIIGVDSLGNRFGLLQLPAIALGIAIINFLLAKFLQSRDLFLAVLAIFTSLVSALILAGAVFLLYLVN